MSRGRRLTLLKRWSAAGRLDDLDVFAAVEAVEEGNWAEDACLDRSWSPGLGCPTLVAPVLIMAANYCTTGRKR